jgi:hypothetical protein
MMTRSPGLSVGTSLIDVSLKSFAIDRPVERHRRRHA